MPRPLSAKKWPRWTTTPPQTPPHVEKQSHRDTRTVTTHYFASAAAAASRMPSRSPAIRSCMACRSLTPGTASPSSPLRSAGAVDAGLSGLLGSSSPRCAGVGSVTVARGARRVLDARASPACGRQLRVLSRGGAASRPGMGCLPWPASARNRSHYPIARTAPGSHRRRRGRRRAAAWRAAQLQRSDGRCEAAPKGIPKPRRRRRPCAMGLAMRPQRDSMRGCWTGLFLCRKTHHLLNFVILRLLRANARLLAAKHTRADASRTCPPAPKLSAI